MWRKMPRSRIREEELIERIRNNEQRAMSELYYMYANALTSVCYRYLLQEEDVKDVLQESFVSIFTTIGKFRPQHEQSLKSWMVRIVINRSIRFLRERNRLKFVEQDDILLNNTTDEEPDASEITDDELYELICELPDGYRTVLNLYVFEGCTHRQIAEMLSINERTSSSQLYHAKRLLSKRITEFIKKKQ